MWDVIVVCHKIQAFSYTYFTTSSANAVLKVLKKRWSQQFDKASMIKPAWKSQYEKASLKSQFDKASLIKPVWNGQLFKASMKTTVWKGLFKNVCLKIPVWKWLFENASLKKVSLKKTFWKRHKGSFGLTFNLFFFLLNH